MECWNCHDYHSRTSGWIRPCLLCRHVFCWPCLVPGEAIDSGLYWCGRCDEVCEGLISILTLLMWHTAVGVAS